MGRGGERWGEVGRGGEIDELDRVSGAITPAASSMCLINNQWVIHSAFVNQLARRLISLSLQMNANGVE